MPTSEPNVHIQLIDDPLRSIGTLGDHISSTLLLYLSCFRSTGGVTPGSRLWRYITPSGYTVTRVEVVDGFGPSSGATRGSCAPLKPSGRRLLGLIYIYTPPPSTCFTYQISTRMSSWLDPSTVR